MSAGRAAAVTKLHTAAKLLRALPTAFAPVDRGLVVYDSYAGAYNDHPKAVYDRLRGSDRLHATWVSLLDEPADTRRVRPDSPQHIAALNRASFVVSNSHLPRYYSKRRETTFVQTWHGTPLKRIGFDLEESNADGLYSTYLRDLERDVARWDLLLSSSPFMTETLRRAFRYDGPVLECGSPRNDRLVTATRRTRSQARESLGVAEGQQVLLYAPTFRDDGSDTWFAATVQALLRGLPDSWTVVYRSHPNHRPPEQPFGPRLVDGNAVADINDLFLGSDCLVTDYSSVMFDYLLTGNPVFLFCPDLAKYEQSLRGFYLDIEHDAPGVLTHTHEELMEALASHRPEPADQQRLVQTYAPWDDGRAAARVAEEMLRRSQPA
jgi:CDP-glycerol glycerophosphotransferase